MTFFIFLILFSATAFAYTYRRPIPETPKILPLESVNGVFDYSIINLLYTPLFTLDANNIPVPVGVKDFKVSDNRLTYRFELKNFYFHDGQKVKATDVKNSLEQRFKKKSVNFEAFGKIKGFDAFINGKSKSLSGLTAPSESVLEIQLISEDSDIPFKLTDVRFSISKQTAGKVIGSGPYRLSSQTSKGMSFDLYPKNVHLLVGNQIEKIVYEQAKYDAALTGYVKGHYDDLFFYVVPKTDFPKLAKISHIQEIYFPRTYFVAINSRKVPDIKERTRIMDAIQVKNMNLKCFGIPEDTRSLVPKGFLGYGNHLKQRTAHKAYDKKLKVYITDTIGSETCLKDQLAHFLPKSQVSVEDLGKVLKEWEHNQIDIFVAYFEAESTLHYFGSFNPRASFIYGDPKDKLFEPLFKTMETAGNDLKKNEAAANLAKHIISLETFLPLFHPNIDLVYSNKFRPFSSPFKSASLIPIYDFKFRK